MKLADLVLSKRYFQIPLSLNDLALKTFFKGFKN